MAQVAAGRVAGLFDGGRYEELLAHPGSVYLCARGELYGRPLLAVASDPEPGASPPDLAGSLKRVLGVIDAARDQGCPIVFLFDAPAMYQSRRTAFQGTGVDLLMGREGIGRFYYELGRLADQVPVLGAVFGSLAQAQAFPVAMCHGLVMLKGSSLSIGRPDAVKAMLGEDTSYEAMGGAHMHHRQSGICDHVAADQDEALAWLTRLLGLLPQARGQNPPAVPAGEPDPEAPPLARVIPEELNKPFSARRVIAALADRGSFVELGSGHALEVVTGLARIKGMACALAVSNPQASGAIMFPETCRKLMRFVRLAGSFGLPLVFLADAPGFMIGEKVERAGIVAAGAELFTAIARCPSPRLSVVLRRDYTAGLYAMAGSGFSPRSLLALPGACISVYGPEAVDRLVKGLDLPPEREQELRARIEQEHSLEFMREQGFLDGVVPPEDLRREITRFLAECR